MKGNRNKRADIPTDSTKIKKNMKNCRTIHKITWKKCTNSWKNKNKQS